MMSHMRRLLAKAKSSRKAATGRVRLNLEALEDRCLLSADVVLQWNQYAVNAVQNDYNVGQPSDQPGPGATSRALAIVQAAVYDAANAVQPTDTPYLFTTTAPQGASLNAAVSQAAHDTLVALFPHQAATFDAELAQSLAGLPPVPAQQGEAVGKHVAAAMLAARATDGSGNPMPYAPGTLPGEWRPDPMHLTQTAVGPDWGSVTPFAIQNPGQYQVPPPPAMTSEKYTDAFDYLKAIGGDGVITSTIRTPVQTLIGNYWSYDGSPGLGTPPVAYNEITQIIAQQQGNTVMQNARLFALVNLAMADAGITAWDTKYAYNFWRPVAAIRESDPGTGPSGLGDGNPNTHGDPNWTPLGGAMDAGNPNGPYYTPAFPAYTSGHAAFGAATFQAIADFYGTNKVPFTWTSDEYSGHTTDQYGFVRPEVTRSYATLSQAMYENAQSRIYLGIHWPWDRDAGILQGTQVANYTFQHVLLPLNAQTPAVVQLPLGPQHGEFASPADAARGITFQVTELNTLRSHHGTPPGTPQGHSGPAGNAITPGEHSAVSAANSHTAIGAKTSTASVGDSDTAALAALLRTGSVGAGLPAAASLATQPTPRLEAFQRIHEVAQGWGSIPAARRQETHAMTSAASGTEESMES
jgi:hypothetical protein